MLVFRQLFDATSSTYTYLLGDRDAGEALLIDPVFEQARRDGALLRELDLRLVATLETHVHADHVTGAWLHRQRSGSRIAVAATSGAQGIDLPLHDGDCVAFGRRHVQARTTPGHTDGCLTFVLDDETMAFTGDALLIRGCGRTDFQQGDPAALYRSVRGRILSLPAACLLYPAHDYSGRMVTTVDEERRFNPRFGGDSSETDFVGYMNHLGLPHPKQMDVAVPANLRCGRPESEAGAPAEPSWAPLNWTFAGLWEIQPEALEDLSAPVQVVDVRTPGEYHGPLGHIRGAMLLPMDELASRIGELDPAGPVVTVCRSGTRSAQAATLLGKAGFGQVANLAGGMLRWRARGHAVEGGAH
jgi:glyoxylase-like metal-dependent hydrolase (beta-lactamase superfamily II)/rhodanese-related sulfurtransferase